MGRRQPVGSSDVSQAKQRKSSAAQSSGLPSITLGKGLGLLAALLLTGALISILMGTIGWAYLAFLVIGSLLVALIVEERGLFLTVASIPIVYAITVGVAGFFITKANLPEGASAFSKTAIVTAAFPLVQRFLWLLIALVGAAIIAWLRWARYRKTAKRTAEMETASRRADAEQDRRNREERLSVADLMARDKPAKNSKQSQAAPQRARASHTLKKSRPAPKDRLRGRDREERRRMQQEERDNPLRPDPARRAGDSVPASQQEKEQPKQGWDDNLYDED